VPRSVIIKNDFKRNSKRICVEKYYLLAVEFARSDDDDQGVHGACRRRCSSVAVTGALNTLRDRTTQIARKPLKPFRTILFPIQSLRCPVRIYIHTQTYTRSRQRGQDGGSHLRV